MKKSDSIKNLLISLARAQSQFKPVTKDSENTYFNSKYASLGNIWDSIKKSLSDNGFSIVNTTDTSEYGFVLETILYHDSGEWISSTYLINPVKNDPQSYGSAVTYARRYSLCVILGIIAEEDDDANLATFGNAYNKTTSNSKADFKQPFSNAPTERKSFGNPDKAASPKQINLIKNKLKYSMIPESEWMAFLDERTGKTTLEALTNKDINTILDAIAEMGTTEFTKFADAQKPSEVEFF